MVRWEDYGLHDFLVQHPKLRLIEKSPQKLVIEGMHEFDVTMKGFERLSDSARLRLVFPGGYPREVPEVFEIGDRIQKDADHHINEGKGNCCLGSDIRILDTISKDTCLNSFLENCVNNFLYRIFYKIRHKVIPGNDLLHGEEGLIQDYEAVFNIKGKMNVILLIKSLASRKRVANKLPCPCSCGSRLGKCSFRFGLKEWRKKGSHQWYRDHLDKNFTPIQSNGRNNKRTH